MFSSEPEKLYRLLEITFTGRDEQQSSYFFSGLQIEKLTEHKKKKKFDLINQEKKYKISLPFPYF